MQLPARPGDGHKGTFGTVCVLGGQAGGGRVMIGGPALSALAALRSGAGLAVLAMPEPVLAAGLMIAPSATGIALPVDRAGRLRASDAAAVLDTHLRGRACLAAGPGFGAGEPQQQMVIRLVAQEERPIVVDADALNALAALTAFERDLRAPAILTPHPGEFTRLAAALRLDEDGRDAERRTEAAESLAQRLGCIVVLKGAGTVVTDGTTSTINTTGNVALATAGSGDVLTGIIAGFVAQFHGRGGLSLLECARLAVHVHGAAADQWAARRGNAGMLASDLLDELPGVIAAMR